MDGTNGNRMRRVNNAGSRIAGAPPSSWRRLLFSFAVILASLPRAAIAAPAPMAIAVGGVPGPITTNSAAPIGIVPTSPGARFNTGSYAGDGSASRAITGLGFQPDFVMVKGVSDGAAVATTSTLVAQGCKELGPFSALQGNLIVSLDADGFTLGSDTRVNGMATSYTWIAARAAPGAMAVGSYDGSGAVSPVVTGLGFSPGYVIVMGAGTSQAVQRYAGEGNNKSAVFGPYAEIANAVKSFDADGFSVGPSSDVNALGVTYHYVAWNALPGVMSVGTYTGDAVDNRAIAGAGFASQMTIVKNAGVSRAVLRSTALVGDQTLPFISGAAIANAVQGLLPDGYQAGTDSTVNAAGQIYYWAAFRDPAAVVSADLAVALSASNVRPNVGDTLTYLVNVADHGPDPASGVVVNHALPAGLAYVANVPSQGTYAPATGVWTLGDVAVNTIATLAIRARVTAGLRGTTFVDSATVTASGTPDPVSPNNAAKLSVTVQRADVSVLLAVDKLTPAVGDSVAYTVAVQNSGPDAASRLFVLDRIPTGLAYAYNFASQGTYSPATGVWSVGTLAAGTEAKLRLVTVVAPGTYGRVISDTVSVASMDQADPSSTYHQAFALLQVLGGAARLRTGTYVGNGLASNSISGLGYAPDFVYVKAMGTGIAAAKSRTMAGTTSKELGSATTLLTNAIVSLDAAGFSVGSDARFNAAGMTYSWVAFRSAPTAMVTGSYVGSGLATHAITGFGFQPDYAIVMGEGATQAAQRFAAEPAGSSLGFGAVAEAANAISSFNLNGITVGASADANQAGVTYHYVAWRAVPNAVLTRSYVGNGTDNTAVTVGFAPDLVLVKSAIAARPVYRASSWTGDSTLAFPYNSPFPNSIQRFIANASKQYEIGTDSTVNLNTRTYYTIAFRDSVPGGNSDLAVAMLASRTRANAGDTLSWVLTVTNNGIDPATGVELTDLLPAGVTFLASSPSQGAYLPSTGVWAVGGLAYGASATLTLAATVNADALGSTLTNTATVTRADQADLLPGNDTASSAVRIPASDLGLTLAVNRTSSTIGDTLEFALTLKNAGPDSSGVARVAQKLPTGLTYRSHSTSAGSYLPGTGEWSLDALAAADSATLVVTATVDSAAAGTTVTDSAFVVATAQGDPAPVNNRATVAVEVQIADVSVNLSVNKPVADPGGLVTYTVALKNYGPSSASGIVVTDRLPAGLNYDSNASSQGSYAPATGLWTVGALASGASAALTLRAIVDAALAGVTLTNAAALTAMDQADPLVGNNRDSVNVRIQSSDLDVTVGLDRPTPNKGDTLRYTVALVNHGPDPATGITVTDRLPAGVSYHSSVPSPGAYVSASGAWTVGSLASGSTASLVIVGTLDSVAAGATLADTAAVTEADQGDPIAGNNSATIAGTIQSADLGVVIAVDQPAPTVGDTLAFKLTVYNAGPDAATSVIVAAPLPSGLAHLTFAPSQGTFSVTMGAWDVGVLAAGSNASLVVAGRVDTIAAGTTLVEIASVDADQADSLITNNRDTLAVRVRSADLRVKLAVNITAPPEGSTIAYTVTLTNAGPDSATGIALRDTIPAGLSYIHSAASRGSYAPAGGVWSVGSVASGDSVTLTLVASVNAGTSGTKITDHARLVSAWPFDPTAGSDGDSVSIRPVFVSSTVVCDLELSETTTIGAPNVGDTLAFVVILKNLGPDAGGTIQISAPLPSGFTFRFATPTAGTYAMPGGTWSAGALAAGASDTLVLGAIVGPAALGSTVTATATVTALTGNDPVPGNNTSSVAVTVPGADLAITLRPGTTHPNVGDTLPWLIKLHNLGPDAATAIIVRDLAPLGSTYRSSLASHGTYAPGNGVWTIGSVASGDSASLTLVTTVDSSRAATTLMDTARVVTAREGDPSMANNQAYSTVQVKGADLSVVIAVDHTTPNPGDTLTIAIAVTNGGPDSATSVIVREHGTRGVTSFGNRMTRGIYAQASGLWALPSLAPGASDTMWLSVTVNPGSAGLALADTVRATAASPADPLPANNTAIATARVQAANLAIALATSDPAPAEGGTVTLTVTLANKGPDAATQVSVTNFLPAELAYQSSRASHGGFDSPSGVWTIARLDSAARDTLRITATVVSGTGGHSIADSARAVAHEGDTAPGDNAARVGLTIGSRPIVSTRPIAQVPVTLVPGTNKATVLRVPIYNGGSASVQLDAIVLTNLTLGAGTQAQLDSEWQPLSISPRFAAGPNETYAVAGTPGNSVSFVNGEATFSNLGLKITPGDSVELVIVGGASSAARDGDVLDLGIAAASDIQFSSPLTVGGTWPLSPSGAFAVDGMSAAQIQVQDVGGAQYLSGSRRNLAFSAILPANGYAADVLQKLNVSNEGSAVAGSDITLMELWRDADGNGRFDPATDVLVGPMPFTGDRWEITGLSLPVPVAGLQMYVSCDLSETAGEGRTLRLALPGPPDMAVGMQSNNDGPIDGTVDGPSIQTVSTADRIVLTAQPVLPGITHPGARDVPLIHFTALNSYTLARVLSSLTVTNQTTGAGTPAQRDNEITQLNLRFDGNGDGQLGDLATDPLLGTTYFRAGLATFTGLGWSISPAASVGLFVTADVSAQAAADADILAATIVNNNALAFTANTALAASWPLDSGVRWTIDGMTAAQIVQLGASVATLGRNDGPALALNLIVPPNGYTADVLERIQLVNAGTATVADMAEVRLWRDGGDGAFDAGSGDDRDLGAMAFAAGRWTSLPLSEPLSTGGARVFASVRTAATVSDSATVKLQIPTLGVQVQSGNDGPVDATVTNPNELRLSNSALLASVEISPASSSVGQTVTARLSVHNVSAATVTGIAPSALLLLGDGAVSVLTTPGTATLDLAPGASGTFQWTLQATAAGTVYVRDSAAGTDQVTGLVVTSDFAMSNAHYVSMQARDLDLFYTGSMPFAINRGQTQVVPLTLTFTNPGGDSASAIRLRRITVRLENAARGGIIPADLIGRVVVNEGTTVFLTKTVLETSGSSIDLSLAQPAQIGTGGESGSQVTLSLSFDILPNTTVPNFRIAVDGGSSIAAEDANSGAAVTVQLDAGQNYPLLSGLARVVAQAVELDLAAVSGPNVTAGAGQGGVSLFDADLVNPGPAGLGSDVRTSGIAVTLIDSTGAVVAQPAQVIKHVQVRAGLQTFLDRDLGAADDSTFSLVFASLLSIPVATPTRLSITASVQPGAAVGRFWLQLADSSTIDARDANTGQSVPARYSVTPLRGPQLSIQWRADSANVRHAPAFPATLPVGSHDVSALTLVLRHPGRSGAAAIDWRGVTLRCRNQLDQMLVPADYLDRVHVLQGGTEVGLVTNLPTNAETFTVPLAGVAVAPGDSVSLEVRVDVKVTAAAVLLGVEVPRGGLDAVDHNLASAVMIAPAPGTDYPLASGLTQLQLPARQLVVGFAKLMPAVIVADGRSLPVAEITLRNSAPATSGGIEVDHLEAIAADRDRNPIVIGAAMTQVEAWIADTLWAQSAVLDPGATSATLTASRALTLAPATPVHVALKATLRPGGTVPALRLGCDAAGIGVVQPGNLLLSVLVTAESGLSFPFWTDVGSFSGLSLKDSYSNFPNPFAAGREPTRFVFYMRSPGRVSLRIWTAHGEVVRTILDGRAFGGGLQQDVAWDGRNGNGSVVVNGAYLGELQIHYDDGTSERVLRKVAVVR